MHPLFIHIRRLGLYLLAWIPIIAILADGTRLPVSRSGYARLKTLLDARA